MKIRLDLLNVFRGDQLQIEFFTSKLVCLLETFLVSAKEKPKLSLILCYVDLECD